MRRTRYRYTAWALTASLALSGCGGGAVAVRSDFSGGASAPPIVAVSSPAPISTAAVATRAAASSGPSGLTVSGGSNLGLAIVLGLMIVDGVQWVGLKLKEAFGDAAPLSPEPDPGRISD